jgi:cell division protein ZapA (FtsZ GTPase activity inhibitor)
MEDRNRVTVKIHGQECSFSATESKEYLYQLADSLNELMDKIEASMPPGHDAALPLITALNLADERLRILEEKRRLEQQILELQQDSMHYAKLWEDAKRSFARQQEENKQNAALEQRCKELENSCFQMQQELMALKGEGARADAAPAAPADEPAEPVQEELVLDAAPEETPYGSER